MNCPFCGRNLKEDSRFCDFCGTKIETQISPESEPTTLDTNLLVKWLLLSLLITVGIFLITKGLGLPVFFGGLFLPFFFRRKVQK